jgi:hypothetical protein
VVFVEMKEIVDVNVEEVDVVEEMDEEREVIVVVVVESVGRWEVDGDMFDNQSDPIQSNPIQSNPI